MANKKLSEFVDRITSLLSTDRTLISRGSSGIDYYTSIADIANYITGEALGVIPASSSSPVGINPTISPSTGKANIILQTGAPPKLWLGISATEWASVDLTIFSSGGSYDTDTDTFLGRLEGTYSAPQTNAINNLIVYLKGVTLTDGGTLWAATDGLWLRCLDTVADSRLNLKGDVYPITDVGGTFTTFDGMTLDGVDDYFEVAIAAANVPAGHFSGAYITEDGTSGTILMYEEDSYINFMEYQTSGANKAVRANISNSSADGTFGASANGSSTMTSRTGAFGIDIALVNKQAVFTEEGFGAPFAYNGKIVFGAYSDPAKSNFLANNFAACWTGITPDKGLTPAEAQGLNDAIETCVSVLRGV